MSFTVAEISNLVGGTIIGDATLTINGFANAAEATEGHLTFADTEDHFQAAEASGASAILVPPNLSSSGKTLIHVPNARVAMAKLLPHFFPEPAYAAGIHPSASIAPGVQIDPTAHIGPFCVISDGATIGARCVLMGGNHLGPGTTLAEDVQLFPQVTLYSRTVVGSRVRIHAGATIGSDGYGYVFDQGCHRKVLQVGNVVIHDDVEIGANTAIDRGALGSTIIGKGTKIDNLVHVAHNVVMGQHCLILGQVGFAGSTHLGDYTVIAAQSGIAGHLKLGRQSTVGAKSGVMRDIPDGGSVLGIPAAADKQAKRQWVAIQKLPELVRKVRELEAKIQDLSKAAP
jgi:UDP-3-O-[3-hydroxymyristoyl] glucosamine N-acyltransferase